MGSVPKFVTITEFGLFNSLSSITTGQPDNRRSDVGRNTIKHIKQISARF